MLPILQFFCDINASNSFVSGMSCVLEYGFDYNMGLLILCSIFLLAVLLIVARVGAAVLMPAVLWLAYAFSETLELGGFATSILLIGITIMGFVFALFLLRLTKK